MSTMQGENQRVPAESGRKKRDLTAETESRDSQLALDQFLSLYRLGYSGSMKQSITKTAFLAQYQGVAPAFLAQKQCFAILRLTKAF